MLCNVTAESHAKNVGPFFFLLTASLCAEAVSAGENRASPSPRRVPVGRVSGRASCSSPAAERLCSRAKPQFPRRSTILLGSRSVAHVCCLVLHSSVSSLPPYRNTPQTNMPAATPLQLPNAAAHANAASAGAPASGAVTALPTASSGHHSGTSSDPEATRLYPVLVLLDAHSHAAAAQAAANEAAAQAAAAAAANPGSEELAAAAAAAANPTASPSAWLLQPSALSTQVIPAFAAMLAALPTSATPAPSTSSSSAAASASAPASSPEVSDVVLLTREDVETALPKKKGSSGASAGASKDAKKKKGAGEELSAEEAYEAANYTLPREIVEQLKERIDAALASAREAMLERRRIEAELLLDPTGGAGADSKGKFGAKGGKKPVAGATGSASKSKAGSSSTTPAQPPSPKSGSNKKSSGKGSSRPSRSPSPSSSKPGTPSQTARGESGAYNGADSGAAAAVRYPLSMPVHFVLFDVVRTVGDAQRIQEIVGHGLDAWVQLEDPALQAAREAANAAAEANDLKEFLYGSPTTRNDSDAQGLTEEDVIEARLAREAREEAVSRAAVPLPHPHDQTVYGKRPPVAPLHAPEGSLLASIVAAQSAPNSAFRNLVFLPVVLPVPTSAPTLGTSISTLPPMSSGSVAAPNSPPASSRGPLKAGISATAAGAPGSDGKAAAAPAKDAKKPSGGAGGKKGAVEAAAPPSPEAELAQRLVGDLILTLREFSQSRADFSAWGSRAKVVPMPRAPAPLDSVDCRLYNHLLASLPPSTVDVSTMLYAMFEQVGAHAPSASAAAPSGVDLNAFFAGEKLDAVEEYMSQALSRVTFNATGGAASAQGWASSSGDLSSPKSLSASGVLGGRARFEGEGGIGGETASPFLKYDDALAIRRAEAALALGLPLVPDATSAAAEELLASRWPLPGVGRRGMPSKLGEAAIAKAGEEATTLLARATGASSSASSDEISGPLLSPAVFERALLLLELEEMLLVPAPDFKHTLLAAHDPAQDCEKEVKVIPAGGSGSVQTPATASLVVRERNPGCSLYHTAHTRVESSTIEAAVGARLRELHAESKAKAAAASTASGATVRGGFGPGFGLRDESDAGEDRQRWSLEQRSYQEELDARVLPQRLREAMFPPCPSEAVHTQVRYRPLSDELLVVVAAPIPLTRRRTVGWSQFLTPNLSLQRWLAAGVPVQRQRPLPRVLYEFDPECSAANSGKLASKVETFFAVEQGRLGVATSQVGETARAFVFLEKEGILVTMEKVPLEEEEDRAASARAAAAAAAAAAANAATVELVEGEEADAGKSTSRPSSRGDGTARDSSRKGSAGRERSSGGASSTKKPAAVVAGSGAGAAPLKKPSSASGSASKSAGPQTATSKRKAAQEAKEAEEAAAIIAAQQAEADAAARQILAVQAAAEARLRAPPKAPREAILLAARLPNDTRFVVSGHRADGSSRASYTARSGLVLEVRGTSDEIYMKYPRSVLEGGEVQPVASARKHGVTSASSSVTGASEAGSAAESFFQAPPLVVQPFSSEVFRSVAPSGSVFKRSQDGSSWILLPNGHGGYKAGAQSGWVWTTNEGERFGKRADGSIVELVPIQVAQQYDAESGATVWTRADATMFISYADGSSLAQHADGTRIYVDELVSGDAADSAEAGTAITGTVSLSPARRRVVVEHPQFPPLTFSHHVRTGLRGAAESFASASNHGPLSSGVERVHAVQFEVSFPEDGGVQLTKHACSDAITLSRRSGEEFLVLPRGRVLLVPASFDRAQLPQGFLQGLGLDSAVDAAQGPEATDVPKHVYEFDLSLASSGRLRLQDTEDNLFRLSCAGVCKMTLGRERNLAAGDVDPIPAAYYPLPSPPAQPRLFVVRGDGTGCELLHNEQVQAFLAEVANDPQTKVMQPESFLESVGTDEDESRSDEQHPASVSMKYLTTLVPRPPYTRHPVIPNVVRAAPSGLAAGSSLAALGAEDPLEVLRAAQDSRKQQAGATPPTLVFRHLILTPTVSAAQKARAAAERAAFADWQESQRAADAAYERDAARAAGGARAAEEKAESARVEEEVARARQSMRARKNLHQHALSQHEQAAVSGATNGGGTHRGSRPSTANAHRLPSSQHLLPKPLHEADEAQQVVEAMVQTLKQPPKTFFAAKEQAQTAKKKSSSAAGASATGVLVRPPSASALAAQASGGPASFSTFFSQPAFRRDFLLSTLAARVNDLAAPYIPGSHRREAEEGAMESQDAAEQEELWVSLDAPAREQYARQFSSQLRLLTANCESFAGVASAFLSSPYNPKLRQLSLQSPDVLSILRGAHDGFAGLVDTLASALGFERENESYVLTTKDDAEFRENLAAFKAKMQELRDSDTGAEPNAAAAAPVRQSQARAPAEEAKESRSAATADNGDDDGLPDGAGESVDFEAVVASLTAAERASFMASPAYQQYLAREARLKGIKATYATQQHASHGASFKATSPFAPHQPHFPPQPARTALSANPLPTALDVTGAPRRVANRVALPAALAPGAESQLNQKHLLAELQSGQPRPAPKTSSTVRQTWHDPTAPFAQFVLQPAELDMGVLRKGCTYRATVTLTNAGSVTGRFQVVQPDPALRSDLVHIKVLYRPGLVAPGLQRRLEVELYAGSVGAIDERIEVRAEAHVFSLPLHARVLSDSDYARAMDGGVGAASPLGGQGSAVASVHAPALNATYARNFPASPFHKNAAGPFTLTSTFTQPTKAGPAFSKNSQ